MFKRIRTKLALVLAVPLVILIAVSGVEIASLAHQASSVKRETDLALAAVGPGGFIHAYQQERDLVGADIAGAPALEDVSTVKEAVPLTDQAEARLEQVVGHRGPVVGAAFAPAFQAFHSQIGELRNRFNTYTGPKSLTHPVATAFNGKLFIDYNAVLSPFFDATAKLATGIGNSELRNGVELLDAAQRYGQTQVAAINAEINAVLTPGTTVAGVAGINQQWQAYQILANRMTTLGVGRYAPAVQGYFAQPKVAKFNELLVPFLIGKGSIADLQPILANSTVGAAVRGETPVFPGVLKQISAEVTRQANNLVHSAQRRLYFFIGGALLAILLAIAVMVRASRSITRPLLDLARQADDMAKNRLPEAVKSILDTPIEEDVTVPERVPVTVRSKDEVAQVANSLNTVQDSALSLALEQALLRRNIADSFVNLGRRNQNLLGRQLEFITALERKQTSPDSLHDLFRLDHLATRMRRNAESLLVLAGMEAPRQWTGPVTISDVVRSALAEVEEYRRVSMRRLDQAMIVGSAASDLAHILAELMENGLAFSPPDRPVEVHGRPMPNGYLLAVVDDGIGMSPEDMELANRRLAGIEAFTVAPSRYLGHYVAGHLAARHGISVRLRESDAGGVTAHVVLPHALLEEPVALPSWSAHSLPVGNHTGAVMPDTLMAEVPDAGQVAGQSTDALTASNEAGPAIAARLASRREPLARRRTGPEALDEWRPSPSVSAPQATTANALPLGETTASGLTKRVPGSTLFDMPAHPRRRIDSVRSADRTNDAAAEDAAGEVYSMLSDFWSGVDRGVREHRTGANVGLAGRRPTHDTDSDEG